MVADMLSRIPDDDDLNLNSSEDYLDIVVAKLTTAAKQSAQVPQQSASESSKSEIETTEEGEGYEYLEALQNKDEELKWVKQLVKGKSDLENAKRQATSKKCKSLLNVFEKLKLLNNLLYYASEDESSKEILKFVLPEQDVTAKIDMVHAAKYGGHLGRRKTYKKLKERFFCPSLKSLVEE